MTFNTAFTFASKVSNWAGGIKWALGVAGALAAASAIDLTTGFSLTVPEAVIAAPMEVKAVVPEIDEFASQKKAASTEELPPQF